VLETFSFSRSRIICQPSIWIYEAAHFSSFNSINPWRKVKWQRDGRRRRGEEGGKLSAAAAATQSSNLTLSDLTCCNKLMNCILLYIFSPSHVYIVTYLKQCAQCMFIKAWVKYRSCYLTSCFVWVWNLVSHPLNGRTVFEGFRSRSFGSVDPWNVGILPQHHTASQLRRPRLETSPL